MWERSTYEDTDYGLDPDESFEPAIIDDDESIDLTVDPHVMTVLGPLPPEELGVCLHHEHILCDPKAVTEDEPDFRLDDIDRASEELESFVTAGGRAILDASPRDYGRDLAGLREIAQRVPVHIIGVTGRHKDLHASRMENALDVDSLAAEYVSELKAGVGADAIRPGVIKLGTSLNEMTAVEEAATRAAARAHLLTGTPITTHLEAGTHAHQVLDVLEGEGVSPSRVILGHLDRSLDQKYITSLLNRGAFCSFDQIGKPHYGTDAARIAILLKLVEAGFADRLLISQDFARKSALTAYGGRPGLVFLLERFTVQLMEGGATADLVVRLLISNPSTALTIVPLGREG